MTKTLRYFLNGIGSIMDIYPDTNRYSHIAPKLSANDRMRKAWEYTDQQIKSAAKQFSDEQKQK
ncbi:hypothetical protein SAMN05428978_10672 [Nitrosomonas sp. Nm34]|nr:hypothetical protein SAMN05428978_10672 [Nitrosomonas sp. Nm34]